MAEKEIKSRIVLDGEKEYSSTIKSASRNLKTLKSELQAETKELGNNATAQQKAEVKAKSLKAQIAEQEKVVKACRAALDEVKEKYGDNEDAVAKYEQKLNNARSALADMNNQLQDVSGSLEQNATDLNAVKTAANTGVTATESFANALEKVSSVGDTVSGAIEGVFSSMIDTVSSAVADMWALISETAAKANNWTDTAALWGTDAQTVQMWSRSMQAAGKDLSSLQTVISRLVLGGKGKQITEMLGISDVNYTDQWEYATKAMDLLYEKMKAGEDITPITEAIFGEKKSTTVMDLLNAWEDIREGLGTFNGDETGYGLTSEGLDMFNELSLQMYEIEAKWEALKDRFAEGFGTTTLTLQAHVIGGLDALADFMNAESDGERQAALEKLTAEVEGFAQDVAAAIEAAVATLSQIGSSLKDSDNPYVSGVGSIFQAIADTMEWIIKNQDDVINALKAIFGFWLVTKIASIAGKLSSIVASIGVIKAWKAVETGATVAGAGAGVTAGAGGASIFAGLAGAALIAWGAKEAIEERQTNENIRGSEGAMNVTAGGNENLTNALQEYVESEKALQDLFDSGDYSDEKADELLDTVEQKKAALDEMEGAAELLQAYSDWRQENSLGNMDWQLPAGWQKPTTPAAEDTTPQSSITQAQREAAETFWDYWKELNGDEVSDEAWDAFEGAFAGNEGLFDQLNDMMDHLMETSDNPSEIGDLPASFWENLTSSETLKKSDVAAFNKVPEDMATAVENALTSGLSGVRVEMDGQTVGNLVLPYINQGLAIAMR